jgi:hypothetical protein
MNGSGYQDPDLPEMEKNCPETAIFTAKSVENRHNQIKNRILFHLGAVELSPTHTAHTPEPLPSIEYTSLSKPIDYK